MANNNLRRMKLGDLLVLRGLITEDQLKEAIEYQKEHDLKIGKALLKMGYIREKELLEIFAKSLKMEVKTLEEIEIDSFASEELPESMIKKYKFFPVKITEETMTIIVNDPYNIEMEETLKNMTGKKIEMYLALERDIEKCIAEKFDGVDDTEDLIEEFDDVEGGETDEFDLANNENASAVVKIVNKIVKDAYEMRASDIHIEPLDKTVQIRQRIDGVMYIQREFPKNVHQAIIARLKIMSNLNIAERRKPQDGRIKFKVNNKEIDARISVISTINGEKATIRILDKENVVMDIDKLGIEEKQLVKFKRMISTSTGVVLVTGPTGSGKTSTLYTVLNEVNNSTVNIQTVEDPVEYTLNGINQTAINEQAGLTFPVSLRAFLRQDPDIMMIGEIRDDETAEIAIKASMTGHKVYATLHTDKASDAIGRLISMKIPDYLIATTLTGVISQRLIRKVCDKCKEEYVIEEGNLDIPILGIKPGEKFYKATGKLPDGETCYHCKGLGYKGRIAIHEILEMNYELRKIISEGKYDYSFEKEAKKHGLITLSEDAIQKAKIGLTTLDEVKKIIGFDKI